MNDAASPPDGSPEDFAEGSPASGEVTAIKPQARQRDRVSLFLDGAFAAGLHREVVEREGVRLGDHLSAERLIELRTKDEVAKATEAALVFLGYRPRTEREVRDRLREKGYAPVAIEATVDRLHGWRYLDDADFARRWVENRATHRPRGRRLLEQELRRKGVAGDLAKEASAAVELDEGAAALELTRKRLGSYAGKDAATVRRRLGSFLMRRGFGYDVVRPTLDRVLGEQEEGDEIAGDGEGEG